jgi:hypothetical protein
VADRSGPGRAAATGTKPAPSCAHSGTRLRRVVTDPPSGRRRVLHPGRRQRDPRDRRDVRPHMVLRAHDRVADLLGVQARCPLPRRWPSWRPAPPARLSGSPPPRRCAAGGRRTRGRVCPDGASATLGRPPAQGEHARAPPASPGRDGSTRVRRSPARPANVVAKGARAPQEPARHCHLQIRDEGSAGGPCPRPHAPTPWDRRAPTRPAGGRCLGEAAWVGRTRRAPPAGWGPGRAAAARLRALSWA